MFKELILLTRWLLNEKIILIHIFNCISLVIFLFLICLYFGLIKCLEGGSFMYKKISLEKFEILEYCFLQEHQIDSIKEEIEYHIGVLNEGINEGRDFLLDSYMQKYFNELTGMRRICSKIGIYIKFNKEN